MTITLAFDVYGTLIDTHGVISALEKHAGSKAAEFSRVWREKQLEYSFRRGLMQNYANFAVCTSDALEYTCAYFRLMLSIEERKALIGVYELLPAFADVEAGLSLAREAGFRMFAFSNGSAEAVELLLQTAGIGEYFLGIVSVDEIKSYKPNPGVYSHFLRKADAVGAEAWLVSSNPFDVIGAVSFGMRAAWLKRSPEAIFDPWGIEPTLTASNLASLIEQIGQK
ncbi:haloacetate dehalogenase H-2 [mine drainage metagenome]|uniref:Haloacetate dehalogenase H-2 n=1 Tax=mine drainage metagenome TaxID=410659 RepID=A0A1J5S093_9ZZZZ